MKQTTRRLLLLLLLACTMTGALAQNSARRTLKGTVYDEEGIPLAGAGIYIAAEKNGTVADLDGNYSLTIKSSGKVIVEFSFIGMTTERVTVGPDTRELNVTLMSDTKLEAAVINAGYGVIQSKENLTGSAFEVRGEDLKMRPANRIDDLLVGQVPGMSIMEDDSNGRPNIKIRIRGDGSLSASSEPLWIIDGVPVYTGSRTNTVSGTNYSVSPLSYMNPDDIESMTVLKDASTTALYGADGANGVILVTTKKASSGQTSYNASIKYGITNIDRSTSLKFVSAEQWRQLAMEGWTNSGRPAEAFPYQDSEYNSFSTTDTDWFKEYYGTGQTTEINFSASNGTENHDHFLSAGYFTSTSPVMGNNQQRYSIRDKSTLRIGQKITADVNLAATYNYNDVFSISQSYLNVIPVFTPYNADGTYRVYNYISRQDYTYEPELRKFVYCTVPQRDENDNNQETLSLDGALTVTYKPFKGASITSQSSANFIDIYERIYQASTNQSGMTDSGNGGISHRSSVFSQVFRENLRANYSSDFGKFSVSAMAGAEWTENLHSYLNADGKNFINDFIKEINYSESTSRTGGSNHTQTKSLSYITHGSVTFDKRYTLTASYRRQGNSSFGEFSRWGDFSSVGLTWNVHREHFFNSNFINLLSFKASYGNNGNSRIDTSSAYGSYTLSDGFYYGGAPGAKQSSPANPGLSWENTYITNLGMNLGLFKRINLSVEYYNRLTKDLLYSGRVSSVITDGSVMRNVGEMANNGLEFTLDVTAVKAGDFEWEFGVNGAHNKNIIKKLYKGMHTGFFNYVWMEGASKNSWWLVRWAGVDPVTGAPMWYDKNGNITYTFSYDDRVLLPEYSKEPTVYGGLTNNFSYKNLSLRVMFDYSLGGWDYSSSFVDDGQDIIDENATVENLEHWTTVGEPAYNTKYVYKHSTHSYYESTRCLVNATYIQLRSLSLNYSLPSSWTRSLKMKNVTASIVGDNLYLWTPGQKKDANSYKTIKNSTGMRRGVSFMLSMNF